MMASQQTTTASVEGKEESQDSQLILEALRAELGVPLVSASAEPRSRPDPCKSLATVQKPSCSIMELH